MLSLPIPNPEDRRQNQVKWNDCFIAFPTVVSILRSQAPYWTLAILCLPALQYIFPATKGREFELLSMVSALIGSIFGSVIRYVLVRSYGRFLEAQSITQEKLVPRTIGKIWLLHYTFHLSVTCASLLFLWPGLLLALRASLALPILIFERRSVLGAFNESLRLTRGKMGLLINSFYAPALLLAVPAVSAIICMMFFDQYFFAQSTYSWAWLAEHAGTIILFSGMAILSTVVTLSLIATQVRLYFYLKALENDVASIEPIREGT